MPFTLSHAAAALPFRRFRLVPSALVVGTFAPDFEYFLRLAPSTGYGHTLSGIFVLTLPVSILVLWLFHAVVKRPASSLLPEGIQGRLTGYLGQFRFLGFQRFFAIVFSLLIGIATHVLWDSFTHRSSWLYPRWGLLGQKVRFPVLGEMAYYKAFQHGSTILGLGILIVWFAGWYRTTKPCGQPPERLLSAGQRWRRIAIGTAAGVAGALVRATMGVGWPHSGAEMEGFAGEAVCTFIAVIWWELVVYGTFVLLREDKSTARMRLG